MIKLVHLYEAFIVNQIFVIQWSYSEPNVLAYPFLFQYSVASFAVHNMQLNLGHINLSYYWQLPSRVPQFPTSSSSFTFAFFTAPVLSTGALPRRLPT